MTITISGVEDIQKILEEVAPKHAKNLMRTTVHSIAGEVAKKARQFAPVDKGTLKSAIKTKRLKTHPFKPQSSLYITTGKGAKKDAFYWRFIEYGAGGGSGSHGGEKRKRKVKKSRKSISGAVPFIYPAFKMVDVRKKFYVRKFFSLKLKKAIKREMRKGSRK